jgi:ATP-binding cassette subfamily B multidrug efflux pump
MEKGEIVEMGSHQELLRKDGHYKKLYDLQFV